MLEHVDLCDSCTGRVDPRLRVGFEQTNRPSSVEVRVGVDLLGLCTATVTYGLVAASYKPRTISQGGTRGTESVGLDGGAGDRIVGKLVERTPDMTTIGETSRVVFSFVENKDVVLVH